MIQRVKVRGIDKRVFRSTGIMNPHINDAEERRGIRPGDIFVHGEYLYASSPWEEYVYGYDFDL